MPNAFTAFLVSLFRNSLFLIELRDGSACLRAGKCPQRFLSELEEVQMLYGPVSGSISGERTGGRVRLSISSSVPENIQQRIRNIWALYDYSPRNSGGPPGPPRKYG